MEAENILHMHRVEVMTLHLLLRWWTPHLVIHWLALGDWRYGLPVSAPWDPGVHSALSTTVLPLHLVILNLHSFTVLYRV